MHLGKRGKKMQNVGIPQDIDQLVKGYNSYVLGGLRRMRIPEDHLEDQAQNFYLHCMETKFFDHVIEKVQEGDMDEKKFRAYLAVSIRNCLFNNHKKRGRNPITNATSTTVGTVGEDFYGMDLERYNDEIDASLPEDILEKDFIRYMAYHKPGFLPTLILKLMGYRASDIARIIGKRKETVHYRLEAIKDVLEEYSSNFKKTTLTRNIGSPLYETVGENPYKQEPYKTIFSAISNTNTPITMIEISRTIDRMVSRGEIYIDGIPEKIAGILIASGLEKRCIRETKSISEDTNCRVMYTLLTNENPYKNWGIGAPIFDALKDTKQFTHKDLCELIITLLNQNVIRTNRTPESIAWGFIDTARGYGVIGKQEDYQTIQIEHITVDGVDPQIHQTPMYTLIGENPYERGIHYELWKVLGSDLWSEPDLEDAVKNLKDQGILDTIRSTQKVCYHFMNRVSALGKLEHLTNSKKTCAVKINNQYQLKGENPFQRGLNHLIWDLLGKSIWDLPSIEKLIEREQLNSIRTPRQIVYIFMYNVKTKNRLIEL